MQQQGMSNSQISDYLQRQGYAPQQVFDAMNQASVKGSVENQGQEMFNQGYQNYEQQEPAQNTEEIERIAEAIVDEKWNELTKHINKIAEWKDHTEQKIEKLEQQFTDLKEGFDNLHNAVLGKVNDYDQNIVHLGTEIKAMEKVFQNILPSLTDNVTELSRITKNLQDSKSPKTK